MKDIFSVKAKLGISFGLLLLLVLMTSAISILSLGDSNSRFSSYINGIGKRKELSSELLLAAQQRAISARNLVLKNSPTVRADEKNTVHNAHQRVGALLRELTTSVDGMSPNEEKVDAQRLISDIQQIEALYGPVALNIVDLALKGDNESAIVKINNDCEPLLKKLIVIVTQFIELEEKTSLANIIHSQEEYELQRNQLIIFSLIAATIALTLTLIITRGLERALVA